MNDIVRITGKTSWDQWRVESTSCTVIMCAHNIWLHNATGTCSMLTTSGHDVLISGVTTVYRRHMTRIVMMLTATQINRVWCRSGLLDHVWWTNTSSTSWTAVINDRRWDWNDVGVLMIWGKWWRKVLDTGTQGRQVTDNIGRLQVEAAVARVWRSCRRLKDWIHAWWQNARHYTLVAETRHRNAWPIASEARRLGQSFRGGKRSQAQPVINENWQFSRRRITTSAQATIGSILPLEYHVPRTTVARVNYVMRKSRKARFTSHW